MMFEVSTTSLTSNTHEVFCPSISVFFLSIIIPQTLQAPTFLVYPRNGQCAWVTEEKIRRTALFSKTRVGTWEIISKIKFNYWNNETFVAMSIRQLDILQQNRNYLQAYIILLIRKLSTVWIKLLYLSNETRWKG